MTTSTTPSPTRTVSLPSAPVVIGGVYAICVLGLLAMFVGEILFTDHDPYASEGPVSSIVGVGVIGTAALVIGVGAGLALQRSPERARIGALVFGALSILTLPFFWSGAPGIFGACAAWLGGLTRGSQPQAGAARVAAVVGIFVALLNVVVTVGAVALSAITG
jgi:hypothetical protein